MRTIGLTGGIACGKSTVAALFRSWGIPVLDLDQVAREVVMPDQPAFREIAALWPETISPDGKTLDRKKLGAIIVSDPEAQQKLNAITHPRIRERAASWLMSQADQEFAVVEAALMIETGSYHRYDALVVVSCDPAIQATRLASREGYDPELVKKWQQSQLPLSEKERVARERAGGFVILNNGSERELTDTTRGVLAEIRAGVAFIG